MVKMRTMFVAQENKRKRFQKPNILRKRAKVASKPSTPLTHETLETSTLVTSVLNSETKPKVEKSSRVKYDNSPVKKPPQKMFFSENVNDEIFQITESEDTTNLLLGSSIFINNNEENLSPMSLDVESFLNGSVPIGNISLQEIQTDLRSNRLKEDWCLDFMNHAQEIIIEDVDGSQLGSLRVTSAPTVTSVPLTVESSLASTEVSTTMSSQELSLEYLAGSTMKFKCDISDCKKRFRSEKALKKHKLVHENGPKAARQVTLECPVKKVLVTGLLEEPCGMLCNSKEELVQHLNENHSPEDAMYICAECGRRFFWASGLRAHSRTHCAAAAPLRCAWPGCERAFRQPCRLREHMRAHTGDKPYPCQYPNCGWSFRTASKLMRHALRHTGERRHACSACGRAFRRREHLRDHRARQHPAAPADTPSDAPADTPAACTAPGCKEKFDSTEALKIHMHVAHKLEYETVEEEGETEACAEISENPLQPTSVETFMISLDSPPPLTDTMSEVELPHTSVESVDIAPGDIEGDVSGVMGGVLEGNAGGVSESAECHAARTHCTWPLEPRAPPPAPGGDDWKVVDAEYVLEEDVQVRVEMSEGSESNIYTIRSDLFLHGNILNNEDSEQMPGTETVSQLVVPQTGEADMSLLDAHPTIDLMQEELMYTDSAVDESSFRVFLLSEELT